MSANPGPAPLPATAPARRGPGPIAGRPARLAARAALWGAVLATTGYLVRAEPRPSSLPEGVSREAGLVYREVDGRRLALDLYRPEGAPPAGGWPVVLALHGGGWRGGSRTAYGPEVAGLARHGLAVAVADYRLSRPGRPSWPGNFEDVQEAVAWLKAHAPEYGLDARRTAALGASAGGHLAALLGTAARGDSRVGAVVDLYGPADLPTLGGPAGAPGGPVDLLLGGTAAARPDLAAAASPARRAAAGAAPLLVFHGRADRLVPADQSERLAVALRDAGVPCQLVLLPDEGHGFGLRVASGDLTPRILEFFRKSWDDTPQAVRTRTAPAGRPSPGRRHIPLVAVRASRPPHPHAAPGTRAPGLADEVNWGSRAE
jgi:acetyl esterase/lipase